MNEVNSKQYYIMSWWWVVAGSCAVIHGYVCCMNGLGLILSLSHSATIACTRPVPREKNRGGCIRSIIE